MRRLRPVTTQLNSLISKLDEVAVPSTAAAPVAEADVGRSGQVSIYEHAAALKAKRGPDGIPVEVITFKATVAEVWQEYTKGLSGGHSFRDLEKDYKTRWRCYKGGKEAWASHTYVYAEIERRIAAGAEEADAVGAVQKALDALRQPPVEGNKRGNKFAQVNWKALVASLRKANPKRPRAEAEEEEEGEEEEEEEEAEPEGAVRAAERRGERRACRQRSLVRG